MAVSGESRRKGTGNSTPETYAIPESFRQSPEGFGKGFSDISLKKKRTPSLTTRLVSLDAFRGFIMMMLAANGFGILAFSKIEESAAVWQTHDRAFWTALATHFDHPIWVSIMGRAGVSFWDLIQPAFMFMVGVSMPYSDASRRARGDSLLSRAGHAFVRSLVLVLMGVFLYSLGHDRTNWIFPNVLAQIGLGYFLAWWLLQAKGQIQAAALAMILVGYWGLFYFNPPPQNYDFSAVYADIDKGEVFEGKYAAWSKNGNAAYFFDEWLLPKLRTDAAPDLIEPEEAATPVDTATPLDEANTEGADETADEAAPPRQGMLWQWFFSTTEPYQPNRGGYTTLNFIPSIATTLLGILCGQLLISLTLSPWKKLAILIGAAAVCLMLGVLSHQTVCPIVKRIWTPSWVLFSGGYVIAMLAIFYLLFDLLPLRMLAFPLVVVGMNSILIYMMGQTIRGWTTRNVVRTHLTGFLESIGGPKLLDPLWYGPLTENTATFLIFWLFLFWLYRQRIFLKI